jgi:hypothetical protein
VRSRQRLRPEARAAVGHETRTYGARESGREGRLLAEIQQEMVG